MARQLVTLNYLNKSYSYISKYNILPVFCNKFTLYRFELGMFIV